MGQQIFTSYWSCILCKLRQQPDENSTHSHKRHDQPQLLNYIPYLRAFRYCSAKMWQHVWIYRFDDTCHDVHAVDHTLVSLPQRGMRPGWAQEPCIPRIEQVSLDILLSGARTKLC